jgi:hypothetical protein
MVCLTYQFFTYAPNKLIYRVAFICWVVESNRPFQIVNDPGFRMLMKTGRPDCYIPLAEMLSRDVKNIFVWVCACISKTLKVKSVYAFHRKTLIYLPSTTGV